MIMLADISQETGKKLVFLLYLLGVSIVFL